MGRHSRRIGELEDRIASLVEERMIREIDGILNALREHLTREEFAKVARIIYEEAGEDEGAEGSSNDA